MHMFQVRHSSGAKDTVIVPNILSISEEVSGEERTVNLYFGHDLKLKVKSTDKIFEFEWIPSRTHTEYGRTVKLKINEKEIPFEEFHDWLILQLAANQYANMNY